VIGGMAIIVASLTAWGFMERSGRLSIQVELERKINKCEMSLNLQNDRIVALTEAEKRAKAASTKARAAAEAAAQAHAATHARVAEALKMPAPAGGCEAAYDFLRGL
jgi:hypothetical protein